MDRKKILKAIVKDPIEFAKLLYPAHEFTNFQKSWLKLQLANRETLILAPRGHGKTTVCTIVFVLLKTLFNPNIRALVVSNTQNQAQAILSEIRQHLEKNSDFTLLFGFEKGEEWTESELVFGNRQIVAKEATITALGVFGPLTLRHFDIIVADDLVDFENSRTYEQRQKLRQWVGTTLEPTLEPEGEIHFIGTRYHPQDFYSTLLDKSRYPKMVTNKDTQSAILPNGEALWQSRFSIDWLASERIKKGSAIFECQYMNKTDQLSGRIFDPRVIKFFERTPSKIERIVCGVEPAISLASEADRFACCVCTKSERNIFVIFAQAGHLSFKEQVNFLQKIQAEFSPDIFGIEDVAYQRALVEEARRAGLKVKPIRHNRSKLDRLIALAARFEEGNIFIAPNLADLEEELLLFPEGEHDDLLDALEICISLLTRTHVPAYW